MPDASLHRLTSKADVDFVRRVVDRRVRIREHIVTRPGFRLILRLHLEGPMPDWGHGHAGVPFVVTDARGTMEFGVVQGRAIRVCGARSVAWESERDVRTALNLPRVSLKLETDREDSKLQESHLALALAHAWQLAVPAQAGGGLPRTEAGTPHRELLGALLGALAVPQFVSCEADEQPSRIRVAASLPVGWPDSLRHVPLVPTTEGDLTLEDFLGLLGTDKVRTVTNLASLNALESLEARFGFGHLTHPALEGEPIFGVGRVGKTWIPLHSTDMWSQDIKQIHLGCRHLRATHRRHPMAHRVAPVPRTRQRRQRRRNGARRLASRVGVPVSRTEALRKRRRLEPRGSRRGHPRTLRGSRPPRLTPHRVTAQPR